METVGLSPKLIPGIAAAIAGAVVAIIGAINGDPATLAAGIGLLTGGGVAAGGGYYASPGIVIEKPLNADVSSDELLGDPSPPAR